MLGVTGLQGCHRPTLPVKQHLEPSWCVSWRQWPGQSPPEPSGPEALACGGRRSSVTCGIGAEGHTWPALFDHGCDAVSTVFVAVGTCICCGMGAYPNWMFFCGFVGMFMFFCAHWQTYVSGTLRFGLVDVTEVQIAIIIMYLMSAFGGVGLWDTKLPVLGVKLHSFPILGIIGGALYSCFNYFQVILSGGVGKNGSTVADTSVLSPGLHIGLILTMAFIIFKKSSSQLFELHPCLYIITFGLVISKISNKLVVAHMTKSELYLQDTAFIGPGLLFLNQYFNSFVDEYFVLWAALLLSLVDLTRYCTGVCLQIATHLRINVFSISPQVYTPNN
ncbi:hypothetical protein Z043-108980 [Arapaima gigas]